LSPLRRTFSIALSPLYRLSNWKNDLLFFTSDDHLGWINKSEKCKK